MSGKVSPHSPHIELQDLTKPIDRWKEVKYKLLEKSISLETKIDIVQTALTYIEQYPTQDQDPKILKTIISDLKGDLNNFNFILNERMQKVAQGLQKL